MKFSVMYDSDDGTCGITSRNLEPIAIGIREMVNENYMHCRL